MQWINTTVGDFCSFVYGKAIKKQDQLESGVPVYGSNGIYTYSANELVGPYAVIIGRKGSVGKLHISFTPCWVSDTAFYVRHESLEDTYFTYYLLSTLGLEGMNTDAAVPGLNRDNAHRLEVRIPESVADRRKLIEPLIALDEKIQLNQQINQTLEQMAQAIFKSWFVDFEPVKAKIATLEAGGSENDALLAAMQAISGKDPQQLTQLQTENPEHYATIRATAELFPAAMQKSELGEIPEGWKTTLSGSVIDIRDGTHDSPKKSETGFPLVTSRHITTGVLKIEDAYLISKSDFDSVNKRSKVDHGDILLTMIGTVGLPFYVNQVNVDFAIKNVGLFKTSETKRTL